MILSSPTILPITLYDGDDFDLQLNWRIRCGATYDLTTYNARLTFWPSKTDRSTPIYSMINPFVLGNGIELGAVSPNIWVHILSTNVDFSALPPRWYILQLQTPVGSNPEVDGVWFRFTEGKITYEL